MMKRITALLLFVSLASSYAWADEEIFVNLDPYDNKTQTVELDFSSITFRLDSTFANKAMISVSAYNMSDRENILFFKTDIKERILKKSDPKIIFAPNYPGQKGYRHVSGCDETDGTCNRITPADTLEMFRAEVSTTGESTFAVPFYIAEYRPKKFLSRSRLTITRSVLIKFIVEAKSWTENDPQYLEMKGTIAAFKEKVGNVKFCTNRMHSPSLKMQMEPYIETRDSIMAVIDSILENPWWMSQDLPHISYSELKSEIQSIDFEKQLYDCGKHKHIHSCSYCRLSSEKLYHRIDDTYQQLHTGRISKNDAVKTARAIRNCYRQNQRRAKNSFYGDKISEYYDRIINF